MSLWEEATAIVKDSETIARIKGVSAYKFLLKINNLLITIDN